jgi:hypothetical protein
LGHFLPISLIATPSGVFFAFGSSVSQVHLTGVNSWRRQSRTVTAGAALCRFELLGIPRGGGANECRAAHQHPASGP